MNWNDIPKDRILIDMDLNEWDFVKAGIREKANRLLNNFDTCLDYRLEQLKEKPTNDIESIVDNANQWRKEIVKTKIIKAPYGYKADGTPRKRPGRKV
jgi:hypothetical protein